MILFGAKGPSHRRADVEGFVGLSLGNILILVIAPVCDPENPLLPSLTLNPNSMETMIPSIRELHEIPSIQASSKLCPRITRVFHSLICCRILLNIRRAATRPLILDVENVTSGGTVRVQTISTRWPTRGDTDATGIIPLQTFRSEKDEMPLSCVAGRVAPDPERGPIRLLDA